MASQKKKAPDITFEQSTLGHTPFDRLKGLMKNKVREWLGLSYWRKRVLAFASAQSYDGGAGATYVLLRDRPVSKIPTKANPDP